MTKTLREAARSGWIDAREEIDQLRPDQIKTRTEVLASVLKTSGREPAPFADDALAMFIARSLAFEAVSGEDIDLYVQTLAKIERETPGGCQEVVNALGIIARRTSVAKAIQQIAYKSGVSYPAPGGVA